MLCCSLQQAMASSKQQQQQSCRGGGGKVSNESKASAVEAAYVVESYLIEQKLTRTLAEFRSEAAPTLSSLKNAPKGVKSLSNILEQYLIVRVDNESLHKEKLKLEQALKDERHAALVEGNRMQMLLQQIQESLALYQTGVPRSSPGAPPSLLGSPAGSIPLLAGGGHSSPPLVSAILTKTPASASGSTSAASQATNKRKIAVRSKSGQGVSLPLDYSKPSVATTKKARQQPIVNSSDSPILVDPSPTWPMCGAVRKTSLNMVRTVQSNFSTPTTGENDSRSADPEPPLNGASPSPEHERRSQSEFPYSEQSSKHDVRASKCVLPSTTNAHSAAGSTKLVDQTTFLNSSGEDVCLRGASNAEEKGAAKDSSSKGSSPASSSYGSRRMKHSKTVRALDVCSKIPSEDTSSQIKFLNHEKPSEPQDITADPCLSRGDSPARVSGDGIEALPNLGSDLESIDDILACLDDASFSELVGSFLNTDDGGVLPCTEVYDDRQALIGGDESFGFHSMLERIESQTKLSPFGNVLSPSKRNVSVSNKITSISCPEGLKGETENLQSKAEPTKTRRLLGNKENVPY